MSTDLDIDAWLQEAGYGVNGRQHARAALEEAQLTRQGKHRISADKLPRAKEILSERFYLHCDRPECLQAAQASGREPLPALQRAACARCGGSDNRRAGMEVLEAFQRGGIRKLVVVGGSPSVRGDLASQIGDQVDLRMIDGTVRRTQDQARTDMEWADLVLVWGASELGHKVSLLYTRGVPAQRHKLVTVPRRGVRALLEAAVEYVRRRQR